MSNKLKSLLGFHLSIYTINYVTLYQGVKQASYGSGEAGRPHAVQPSTVGVQSDCLGDRIMSARLGKTTAVSAVAQRLLSSNKDTVIKDTIKCIFESCPYDATDHWCN